MADDFFGGVIIDDPNPNIIVVVSTTPGPTGPRGFSGFSGFSGPGGTGGSGPPESPSGFSSFSGFSGKSGFSGASSASGFSGFSGRSAFSGYSGIGNSGFSGFSGASGISGPGGGNSGYSGYSGLDGTFSASGFSGYSGFSSRSGFSGYSGSGVSGFSAYSGFSGQSISGFSGFSGPGTSGFSGFSSPSGFSGFSGFSARSGFSGFSGFSGTGSPSGGATGDVQYNDGAGGFAGTSDLNISAGVVNANAPDFFFRDSVDPTKKVRIDVGLLPSGTSAILEIPAVANPVAVAPSAATANQFVTGITAAGAITKAQPSFANLSGLAGYGQLDRSTSVVAEAATLTIAANTKVKSTASGVLATIAFSGGDNAQQGRRLDLDITGGPYTLNIPSCRRIGETGTITTLQVFAGYNEFSWEFINGEYVLSDSVTTGAGASGVSGFSGASGRSGYSAYSGFSGPAGAGSSGFSGFSSISSSGFSGFSAPNLLPFTNRNSTDYTLTLADANTGIKMTSASPQTLTVPQNASVPFPLGTQIPIEQGGVGLITITGAIGVTLQGASSTQGVFSVVVLINQAADVWLVAKSGASGFSGYSGGAGAAGSSGFSGFSGGGPSGFSGFSGPGSSGFSGFSSLSGFSGFSGRSGYSGYSAPSQLTFSTQTDVDYTLVLGDANTGVKMTSVTPHNLTVPLNASVAFPIGTQIPIEQGSTGVVTIVATGGVTLQGATVTSGQFSMLVLIKQATDTWLVASGNSGYSGFSGKSGYSGFSGQSGYSSYSGFSGTGGFTKLTVAGSDATTTGQALVDITGLVTGTLLASTLYEIHAVLFCTTSAVNTGTQYGVHAGGTGTVAVLDALITGTGTSSAAAQRTLDTIDVASVVSFLTAASVNGTIEIRGWVVTRSTGTPTLSIQHLKTTSGTSTVKIGSYFEYRVA